MKFLQNAVLAALKRVQLFLDEVHRQTHRTVDLTARKRLDAVVASFGDHAYEGAARAVLQCLQSCLLLSPAHQHFNGGTRAAPSGI